MNKNNVFHPLTHLGLTDSVNRKIADDNCFAKQARKWIWLSGVIIIIMLWFSYIAFSSVEKPRKSGHPFLGRLAMHQAKLVAFQKIPYSAYNPQWSGKYIPVIGRTPPTGPGPAGIWPLNIGHPKVVREFALEVGPDYGIPGVPIHAVYGRGNGDRAGLMKGDIITGLNGRRVKNVNQLQTAIARVAAESTVWIMFVRNGMKLKTKIMVGEGEMDGVIIPAAFQPGQSGENSYQPYGQTNEIIYVAGRRIGSAWLGAYFFPQNDGLSVSGIVENSPAFLGGLKTGDILLKCNGKWIKDIITLDGILDNIIPRKMINISIMRNNKKRNLYFRVGHRPEQIVAGQ